MLFVFKASAGSGKTFNLTREYIKLLLGTKDRNTGKYKLNLTGRGRHRPILAITFTNKATDEMKRRIVHELAVLGECEPGWAKPSEYIDDLTQELNCSQSDLKMAAGKALRELLLDFTGFRVSTIDSFFQAVLRAFAREAELEGNYEVELNSDHVLNLAIGNILTSLRDRNKSKEQEKENRYIEDWILRKMRDKLQSGLSYNLFNRSTGLFKELVKYVSNIMNEEFQKNSGQIIGYLDDFTQKDSRVSLFAGALRDKEKSINESVGKAAKELTAYIKDKGFDPENVLSRNALGAVMPWLGDIYPQEIKESKTAEKMAVGDNTRCAIFSKNCEFRDAELDRLMAAFGTAAVERFKTLPLIRAVKSSIFDLGLIRHIDSSMKEILQSDNSLLLSDTTTILSKIIGDGAAPFVYERIGANLRHFLIDEFQDTSSLQWDNLRFLVENGLSEGNDSLIIGDEKQCIYRFRNSDPTLLQNGINKEFSGLVLPLLTGPKANTNWRSSADVVGFNNDLFAKIAAKLNFGGIYANVRQNVSKKTKDIKGYVSVECFNSDGSDTSGPFESMRRHIVRQLNSGYRPSDIAVLVRGNKEGQAVMDYIMSADWSEAGRSSLRVVSDDSFQLGHSPTVRMIVSILRVLADSNTGESKIAGRRRRYGRFLESLEVRMSEGLSRSEALAETVTADCRGDLSPEVPENCDNETASFSETGLLSVSDMKCVNLTSIVGRIVSQMIAPKVVSRENVFITAFCDSLNDYQQRGRNDLRSFLKWWDTTGKELKVNIPPDNDAIRVMTIHKSKGLEFKCVHIPLASWSTYDPKSEEWFSLKGFPGISPEIVPPMLPLKPAKYMKATFISTQYDKKKIDGQLDELNVTYVAFTRAISELIVSIPSGKPDKQGESISKLIADALGLKPDQTYTVGKPTHASAAEPKALTASDPKGLEKMPSFFSTERVDLWENTSLDNEDAVSEQRKRGKDIHALLARVRYPEDFARECRKAISAGALSEEEGAGLQRRFDEAMKSDTVRRWFDGYESVLCENEIRLIDGKFKRPDRIVRFSDGSVEVVDYKTGLHEAKNETQVRKYVKALKTSGIKDVKGYLWYISTNKTIEVK